MCFSAEASFAGSVVLSAIGVATVKKARVPEQRLFAVIPLLFGIQQFTEGVLWVTLRSGGHERLQNAAAQIFLITALVIWPVMIPLSIWLMEKVKQRRQVLTGIIVAGGIISLFYAFCLISYDVTPQISGFHIEYIDQFPYTLVNIAFWFYVASTVSPMFISSVKRMWLFGILITVSFVVTRIFFAQYLTSVWCFFAALISAAIYWILSESPGKAGPLPIKCQQ
jgi:heme/copper-type cytochrome/quinol oxidase subunit 4